MEGVRVPESPVRTRFAFVLPLAFVFFYSESLLAQNTVSGSVTADVTSVGDAGYVAAFDPARNLVAETGTDIDGNWSLDLPDGDYSFEHRFVAADRDENWQGRHVLEYVTHCYGSPSTGRLVWPQL